jgi:enterochelin esterase-like enzyme
VVLRGAKSGITRNGYVYLPPQYFEHRYATTRFPTLELMHGSPGNANNWLVQINIAAVMNKLIAQHLIGPMIVVLPDMNAGNQFQECVNAPGALDDTYISQDVPQDVRAQFRAATDPAQWGISGYSSGGYCAANLALRHRSAYGAAAMMDAYFRATDGPAAAALHNDPAAEAQNDPLAIAQHLGTGAAPLPSLWLSAGTADAKYARGAKAFAAALHGVEAVSLTTEPGANHNFYAWRAVVPRMLAWMWTAIAPPNLRVQFPIAGKVTNSDVVAPQGPRTTATPSKR